MKTFGPFQSGDDCFVVGNRNIRKAQTVNASVKKLGERALVTSVAQSY